MASETKAKELSTVQEPAGGTFYTDGKKGAKDQ